MGTPRYIIARYRLGRPRDPAGGRAAAVALLRGAPAANPAAYHAVPALLARNKAGARAFARAWNRWVSGGEPLYTAASPSADLLRLHYGTETSGLTAASRLTWFQLRIKTGAGRGTAPRCPQSPTVTIQHHSAACTTIQSRDPGPRFAIPRLPLAAGPLSGRSARPRRAE
ncbi:hypothetical protein GCM10027570_14570 [Streptomonospora sediminis]